MIAAGSLIGRRIGIRPQEHTDWMEVANLWGVIVGEPGTLKSPAVSEALKPLRWLPARETVRVWMRENADLQGQYARARDEGSDKRADEMLEMVNDKSGDPVRDRLRFDAARWYLSKLAPKRYGDKLDVTSDGQKLEPLDPAAAAARFASIMLLAQQRLLAAAKDDDATR